ncbi:multicopper oxidase domain-containing protein [Nocardia otitidiscaviarum]|uniref:multicopper oxidase family protein n=1 Tax=Nocardia otitidiscaviarum TaxID=1823 RepID=UPI0004A71E7E|nr:multicopper oxidase domain-containing protein [Nocardia otitidiscaviarum]MBF6134331.1 multicopper oxidase domain-containing protein [Nocardia otitidiscaviarum]MBF6486043.1 multicopper oxidase domain-containing protein [Nocardia otitidiscaviarum]
MSSVRRSRVRRILVGGAAVLVVIILSVAGGFAWVYSTADISTVGTVDFDRELAIPPLAPSRVDADGTRVFELEMRSGQREFEPAVVTPTWGFNGDHLGPTLRARRGEQVRVTVRNSLPERSSVHWHGMHLPAEMDGGPHQPVAAGATWTPHWLVDQPAATLWYHPHPHGETESHVRRGLAGMFILDDDAADGLALPRDYGVNDLPIIVQDVRFRDGELNGTRQMFRDVGFLGDRILVNGTLSPYREVGDELIRLRLLNASTARVYNFGFADDRPFALIGSDGGLLERPVELNRVQLSPGERAEIVVRMRPAERVVLRGYPFDAGLDFFGQRFAGGDDRFDILELRADETLRPAPGLPEALVPAQTPDGSNAVRERTFDLQFAQINGRPMDMDRIDETVTRATTEIWTVRNTDGMPHNFHVHDVQFRVLTVDGSPPPAALRGPKDTVYIAPGATVRLALRFDGPADPDTPYMYHCHLLWHEDLGMMGQFVVVEPGGSAGTPPRHGGH